MPLIINYQFVNYQLRPYEEIKKNMKTDLTWVRGYGKGFYKKNNILISP